MSVLRQVEAYLTAMQAQGLAVLTMRNQRSHLKRLARFLAERGIDDVAAVGRAEIETYMEELASLPVRKGQPMKPETRNVRLASIKALYRWLVASDMLAADPAEKVAYCREPQALPRGILSVAEVQRLLAVPDPQRLVGFRDRVVLELLYSTGLRVAELCSLDVSDLDFDDGFARVRHGKGDRERVVPVGKLACELVQGYLQQVRPALLRGTSSEHQLALILSQYGRRLRPRGVEKLLARHAKACGFGRVTPHTLRHCCATHMLRGGANIRHLQEILGHRKLTSTEIYTRVTITELKEVHSRFHPRGTLGEADVRKPGSRDK